MIPQSLSGRSILVVEDEPLIAMDITAEFQRAGALVAQTNLLWEAMRLIEANDFSAAILDHGLQDGDSTQLCERLAEKRVPFVSYSGYGRLEGACRKGVTIDKPVHPAFLVATVAGLLKDQVSAISPSSRDR